MKLLIRSLLFILLIVTSTQLLTHFIPYYNLLDEILMLILIGLTSLYYNKIKISKKKALILVIFITIFLISSVYNFYNLIPLIIKSLYYIKTLLVFSVISFLSIKFLEDKDLTRIYKWLLFFCVLSIFEFIYIQFFYFDGVVKYQIWDLTLKSRGGIYRAAALTGHPISLGMMALMTLIFAIERSRKTNWKHILIISATIIVSGSRIPLLLAMIYSLIKTVDIRFLKIKDLKMKYLYLLLVPTVVILSVFNIGKYIESTNDVNASRGMAISKGAILFLNLKNILVGTGVGSFGSFESVEYNSPIYEKIDYPRHYQEILTTTNRGSGIESFLFMILVEMGLIGASLYYLLLIPIKNSYSFIQLFLVLSLIIYSMAYPIYTLPYVFLLTSLFPNFQINKNA